MEFIQNGRVITLTLKKQLTRAIKQGHVWLYSDSLDRLPAPTGAVARVADHRGRPIACGMYCPEHPITVRICKTHAPFDLDDAWLIDRLETAIAFRESIMTDATTGYRVVNGEGDGLPGLILDRYGSAAVIKLDGGAPTEFYRLDTLAQWIANRMDLETVVSRPRGRGTQGNALVGHLPSHPVPFLENGLRFTADIVRGQKTGFFLDQRDNRAVVGSLARNRDVLNLFSFSGGFSIAAGAGGANSVLSVDLAAPAIAACHDHWRANNLQPQKHRAVTADCFHWVERAVRSTERWGLIICDPPSFSPSQETRQSAMRSYSRLAQWTSQLLEPHGLLALASCSSHISLNDFTQANLDGFGKSGRVAKMLCQRGLPLDHPTPLAMPELRYLKFQLFQM